MKISIAIPCWHMNGIGREVLEYGFLSFYEQTLKDFEVIVSDHSIDNDIKGLCKEWDSKLNIKYIKNEENRGNPAYNFNVSMAHCSGEYIKVLCQDDFLLGRDALLYIYSKIKENDSTWLLGSYWHSNDRVGLYRLHTPHFNNNIATSNTYGTPSAMTIKNKNVIEFDTSLKSLFDCEYYYRMHKLYGPPIILEEATMVNYLHGNQVTNLMINDDVLRKEESYVREKHGI